METLEQDGDSKNLGPDRRVFKYFKSISRCQSVGLTNHANVRDISADRRLKNKFPEKRNVLRYCSAQKMKSERRRQ
ncbi:hypothetical protein XELAEV_18021805mg [Xenopus laevis]|uniref:Uncharacterized protein n=1 Tax=Xenopus laevis TaxID=8355 RepID=A0A974D117_XENLA|nr:hypothetical protein XELAEV_18021805mg [Xenopus laevis]